MSDYTPTTEEVRARFNADDFGYNAGLNDPCPEFDRWLAEELRKAETEARKAERSRIIVLIASSWDVDRTTLTAIVDLIDGENK